MGRNAVHDLIVSDPESKRPPIHVEFFWLCKECSQDMTLGFDKDAGIKIRPLRRIFRAAS